MKNNSGLESEMAILHLNRLATISRLTGRRIPIALPNTGAFARRKNTICIRAIVVGLIVLFVVLQVHILNYGE
jgi:hypothetical protein